VLVVDYSMPQMNGVEVCEALRHLPCKKILFTGAADEKVAVERLQSGPDRPLYQEERRRRARQSWR
jgi:CheY-like chemotaxis protein